TPKAKAEAAVITGLKDDVSTAVRQSNDSITIENTDLVIEDQYGQVMEDKELENLNFKVSESEVFDVNPEDTATQSVRIDAGDTGKSSEKLTFKLANDN